MGRPKSYEPPATQNEDDKVKHHGICEGLCDYVRFGRGWDASLCGVPNSSDSNSCEIRLNKPFGTQEGVITESYHG